jgi:hypothetical protein
LFTSSGSRLKREGFSYYEDVSKIPNVISRASAGTIRTLVFDDSLSTNDVDKLVVGEGIKVTGNNNYATAGANILTLSTTTVSNDTLTYAVSGSYTESEVAATDITVTRQHAIVKLVNFWRDDSSLVPVQQLVAITEQGLMFIYDANDEGERKLIKQEGTAVTMQATGDTVTLASHGISVGEQVSFRTVTTTTSITNDRLYYVINSLTNTFQLALTEGGTAVDVDLDGSAMLVVGGVSNCAGSSERAAAVVFNNRLIVSKTRIGNLPVMYNPEIQSYAQFLTNAPDFSICAPHLNRIWTNDKTNKDRLHYCATGSHTEWNGASDSGALDIRPGDGDPEGITAIFAYKGQVFVGKKNRLYRVVGDSPENFQVLDVSSGLGVASHNSVAPIDNDDIFYISSKGIHTVATTNSYGDFTSAFLSSKIQPTFNDFATGLLRECQAIYNAPLNSVAFSFGTGAATDPNVMWLYNTVTKEWYRWPNVSCTALVNYEIGDKPYIFIGTSDGRVIRTQNGAYIDFTNQAIPYKIKTGQIYVDNNPNSVKMFKSFSLFFKPTGSYSFIVRITVDGNSEQALGFSQTGDGDELNQTFILGQSILGFRDIFSPQSLPIDGIGRGITIDIEHVSAAQQVEIHGFAVEYESADVAQESVTSSSEE